MRSVVFDGRIPISIPNPHVVFVVVETAAQEAFMVYARTLEAQERLQAIVVDECHMYLSKAVVDFRPDFSTLPSLVARFRCPIVFLSGTLPPTFEQELQTKFNKSGFRSFRDAC